MLRFLRFTLYITYETQVFFYVLVAQYRASLKKFFLVIKVLLGSFLLHFYIEKYLKLKGEKKNGRRTTSERLWKYCSKRKWL